MTPEEHADRIISLVNEYTEAMITAEELLALVESNLVYYRDYLDLDPDADFDVL